MSAATTILTWLATLLAVALLLLWLATRHLVLRAERAFPPQGQVVTVQGTPVHCLSQGAGPPVVLIHGTFGGLQDFTATIVTPLAARHRVIAADRPGHGYSGRSTDRVITPDRQAEVLHGLLQ